MDGFDDFEIEIGAGGQSGYPVTARAPGGGEAAGLFRLPFPAEEIERRLVTVKESVLLSTVTTRRAPTPEERPVQVLGRELFEALLTGGIRELYGSSVRQSRRAGRELRLVLRTRTPEIARLPWEYMYDSGRREYLGLSGPLLRYPQVLDPVRPLRVTPPLRILGMVARPGEQDPLQVDEEQQRLAAALSGLRDDGLIELTWVEGQTIEALEDALDGGRWHVWHFIGHGGFDPARDEGFVALADEYGRTHRVGAEQLAWWLGRHHPLRLAVLNACQTGQAGGLDVYAGTAGALVRRDVPAVVAMQFEITDAAAVHFARSFYRSVAKQLPVDQAVLRARHHLRLQKRDTLEWGTPVLYLRSLEGRLFDLSTAVAPQAPAPDQPAEPPGAEPPGQDATGDDRDSGKPPDQAGVAPSQEAAVPPAPADVEAPYVEGSAAYWIGDWARAADLLGQFVDNPLGHPDPRHHEDAVKKLERARRELDLAARYADALKAVEHEKWHEAVQALDHVVAVEPGYRDARERLEQATRRREVSDLQSEARRLHDARHWAAVVQIGERLQRLDPEGADPDGVVSSARSALATAERERALAHDYRAGLRHLDAGSWEPAVKAFERITEIAPDYRDTEALLARARQELRGVLLGRALGAFQALLLARTRQESRSKAKTSRKPLPVRLRQRRVFRHDGAVKAVAFSRRGDAVVTGSTDGTARVWSVASGEEIVRIDNNDAVNVVAISPDGGRLALGVGASLRVATPRGKVVFEHRTNRWGFDVSAVAFSPDGLRLATRSDTSSIVWLLDPADGTKVARLSHGVLPSASQMAFSPDGRLLVTAADDLEIWDATNGKLLLIRNPYGEQVVTFHPGAMAFSPDGRFLATCADGRVCVLEAGSWAQLLELSHPVPDLAEVIEHSLRLVAVSPDSRQIAASSDDGVFVWDAGSGDRLVEFTTTKPAASLAFSPDGRLLATSNGGTARVWDAATGQELVRVQHNGGAVGDAVFSPDGRLLATVGEDKTARIWPLEEGDGGDG